MVLIITGWSTLMRFVCNIRNISGVFAILNDYLFSMEIVFMNPSLVVG